MRQNLHVGQTHVCGVTVTASVTHHLHVGQTHVCGVTVTAVVTHRQYLHVGQTHVRGVTVTAVVTHLQTCMVGRAARGVKMGSLVSSVSVRVPCWGGCVLDTCLAWWFREERKV